MSKMEHCYPWKEESYIGCEDTLLTVKTPDFETKKICQPSPDSSNSPPKPVVEQNSAYGMYQGDAKGMFILLQFSFSTNCIVSTVRYEVFNAPSKRFLKSL